MFGGSLSSNTPQSAHISRVASTPCGPQLSQMSAALPRFLAKLLALEQVRDDGPDPLAAALFSAGGFILNPGGDMLGQVGLDGNIACHAGLHGGGAWNTLRKASLFYLCSFTPSSRLKPADFLSFSPDVICVNGEGYSQVRFDGEAANFS